MYLAIVNVAESDQCLDNKALGDYVSKHPKAVTWVKSDDVQFHFGFQGDRVAAGAASPPAAGITAPRCYKDIDAAEKAFLAGKIKDEEVIIVLYGIETDGTPFHSGLFHLKDDEFVRITTESLGAPTSY